MNEQKIINKRWEKIDKELNKFIKNFKYDIKSRIRAIIKTFNITRDNLYNYLSNDDLSVFKTQLQDNINDDMRGYLKYEVDNMLKRTKIKYYEALELLIKVAYFKMMTKAKKFEDELFTATATITSEIVQIESYDVIRPRTPYHLIPLPNYLLPQIMSLPLYLGYIWEDYRDNVILYNANKTYRKVVVGIQQNNLNLDTYDNAFNIERKRYITALDNEIASISSEVAIWGMKQQGVSQVKYVAVMDEKTTNICKSMNGQIFSIDDVNVYYRYANNDDDRMTRYETKGLKIGENQPALHFSCRSILIPYK